MAQGLSWIYKWSVARAEGLLPSSLTWGQARGLRCSAHSSLGCSQQGSRQSEWSKRERERTKQNPGSFLRQEMTNTTSFDSSTLEPMEPMQTLKRSSLLPGSPGCLLTCCLILWPILKAFQEMLLSSTSPLFLCLNSLKFPCSLPSLGICTGFLSHLHKLLIGSIPTHSPGFSLDVTSKIYPDSTSQKPTLTLQWARLLSVWSCSVLNSPSILPIQLCFHHLLTYTKSCSIPNSERLGTISVLWISVPVSSSFP